MIRFTENSNIKELISNEKNVVKNYKDFEQKILNALETYINEFKNVSFENEVLKNILLNNFANIVVQADNNLQNIESLENVLEILDNQDSVSFSDVETYNKLAIKLDKEIELLQNFLHQTISSFDKIPINGEEESIIILNDCKRTMLELKLEDVGKSNISNNSENTYKVDESIDNTNDNTNSDVFVEESKTQEVNSEESDIQEFNTPIVDIQDSNQKADNHNNIEMEIEKEHNNEDTSTTIEKPIEESNSSENDDSILNSLKTDVDFSSSDLLCFFPKSKSDSLVISTAQKNYKVGYNGSVATIYIENESFNLSLRTCGVQISNSDTNSILYVAHSDDQYTIITNSEIEIPNFIQVAKISKNDDFLEVVISNTAIVLSAKDNVLSFSEPTTSDDSKAKASKKEKVEKVEKVEKPISETKKVEEKTVPVKKQVEKPVLVEEDNDEELDDDEDLEELEEKSNKVIEEKVKTKSKKQPTSVLDTRMGEKYKEIIDDELEDEFDDEEGLTKAHLKEKKSSSKRNKRKSIDDIPIPEVDGEIVDNDTLIISDSTKNVTLPYKVSDLEEKLRKNKKYRSLEDVIKNEYTIPLETFKNPTRSRFREAFQLIKKKEHGSLKEAVELGFELMFQSDLNPAIIAACKDLDELDIYLDCLDDNELDKFSCFKIQYDVPLHSRR